MVRVARQRRRNGEWPGCFDGALVHRADKKKPPRKRATASSISVSRKGLFAFRLAFAFVGGFFGVAFVSGVFFNRGVLFAGFFSAGFFRGFFRGFFDHIRRRSFFDDGFVFSRRRVGVLSQGDATGKQSSRERGGERAGHSHPLVMNPV